MTEHKTPAITAMIDGQIRPNKVTDPRIIEAFETTPRDAFAPKALREVAYVDEDLEIAKGRYLMEPMILARLIGLAEVAAEDVVLDIGCGTGYSMMYHQAVPHPLRTAVPGAQPGG